MEIRNIVHTDEDGEMTVHRIRTHRNGEIRLSIPENQTLCGVFVFYPIPVPMIDPDWQIAGRNENLAGVDKCPACHKD